MFCAMIHDKFVSKESKYPFYKQKLPNWTSTHTEQKAGINMQVEVITKRGEGMD